MPALMGKRQVIALAALLVALAAVIPLHHAGAARAPGPDQTRLLLRLSDLALGYMNFDFSEGQDRPIFCSHLTLPEDTPPKLKQFILRFHPRGCISAYYRVFALPGEEPGPRFVGTGVMALGSDRAADAAWRMVPVLLSRLLGDRPVREAETEIKVGNATRLFHATLNGDTSVLGRRTSFLVWRSDNTIAVVEAFGPKLGEDDRGAARLVPLQQAHIENPTPYTGAERYDAEVPLNDPALKQPVYWLGRNFAPSGLSPTRLGYADTFQSLTGDEQTGKSVRLEYRSDDDYLVLDEWNPRQWQVFEKSKLSHTLASWHCTETKSIRLAEGTATVYAGYKRDYRRCPIGPPTSFTARASLPGAFVSIETPSTPGFAGPGGAYASYEAMETILEGLTPRPQRSG
jgi:hypothetical protein